MEKKWTSPARRLLALLLCLAMVLPMFPQVVRAAAMDDFAENGYAIAGNGVIATGVFSGTELNAKDTGNKQIYFEQVTGNTATLYHHDQYLFMNAADGYIMSYDAKAKVSGRINSPGVIRQDDNKSMGTYYIDGNKLYLDHSMRDAAMWVLRSYGLDNTRITSGNTITSTYSDAVLTNGTYFGDYTGDKGKVMVAANPTNTNDKRQYGIELQKGRFGPDDTQTSGVAQHGYYWYTPDDQSNDDDGANWGTFNSNWHFPFLRPDNALDIFGNATLAAASRTGLRMEYYATDNTFTIYYGASGHEHSYLYCDEFGNWTIRHYFTSENGDKPKLSGEYYPHDQIDDDLPRLKMKVYKYNNSSNTTKQVKISGFKNYAVLAGTTMDDFIAAVSGNISILDTSTGHPIPCSGNTEKVGYYFLDTSSLNLNSATSGEVDVPVYYRNDTSNGAAASSRRSLIGTVKVTVKAANSLSATTAYTSKNSLFSDVLYVRSGSEGDYTYAPLTINMDGGFTVPVSVKMLRRGNANTMFDSTRPGTYGSTSVYYNSSQIGTITVIVEDGTIPPHNPAYPNPGSVEVFKQSTTTQAEFYPNSGVANVQLSATGKPVNTGIDLIIMLDLSSSMRWAPNGNSSTERNRYLDMSGNVASNWSLENWSGSRMYSLEEALKSTIRSLQNTGLDVHVAIADFGDIDHYEIGGPVQNGGSILYASSNANYGKWPFMDNDGAHGGYYGNGKNHDNGSAGNQGWAYTLEFPNHLNYIFGGKDVYTSEGHMYSKPYHIYHWKFWSADALSVKNYGNTQWDYNGDGVKDQYLATSMQGKMPSHVYTGEAPANGARENYTATAFQDVDDFNEYRLAALVTDLREHNSYMLGTNYDIGLETAYHLAHARQEDNARKGLDREVVCVFMSDGAAMQYNYFSGYAGSRAWVDWLEGKADSVLQSSITTNGAGLFTPKRYTSDKLWNGQSAYQTSYSKNGVEYTFPTTSQGYVDISTAAKRAQIHPDLLGVIINLRLQGYLGANFTWKDVFNKAKNSGLSIQMLSDGKIYSGSELVYRLIRHLPKTEELLTMNHGNDYQNGTQAFKDIVDSWYDTYSPFWYFYNADGKNWWAEAIKGKAGDLYPVINKYAREDLETGNITYAPGETDTLKNYFTKLGRGANSPFLYNGDVENKFKGDASNGNHTAGLALEEKDYISGFDGLGMRLYTVGFALASDVKISKETQQLVLKNLANQAGMALDAVNENGESDTESLKKTMASVVDAVVLGATQAYYTDTLGKGFELADNSTIKVYKKVYEKNADGSYKLDADGNKTEVSSEILKTINVTSVSNKTATHNGVDIWDNTKNLINSWDDDEVLADRLFYNANTGDGTDISQFTDAELQDLKDDSGNAVHGYQWIDMTGDGKGDVALAPETFFWSIGNMPDYEIMLEYQVYLTGSKEDDIPNGFRYYDTNVKAPLSYIDFRGNQVTKPTKTPTFTWEEKAYTRYRFYLHAVDANGNIKAGTYLKDDLRTETTNLSQAKMFTLSNTGYLPAADMMAYLAVTDSTGALAKSGDYLQYIKEDGTITTDVNEAVSFRSGAKAKVEAGYLRSTDANGNVKTHANGKPIYLTADGTETTDTTKAFTFTKAIASSVNGKLVNGSDYDYVVASGSKIFGIENLTRDAASDYNSYRATAKDLLAGSGVDTTLFEVVNENAYVNLASSTSTQDVDMTSVDSTSTTHISAKGTTSKNDLTYAQLDDEIIYLAVKPRKGTGTIKFVNYLVDSNGNPLKSDGSKITNGDLSQAVKVGNYNTAATTVNIAAVYNMGSKTTTKTAQDVFTAAGVNSSYYSIFNKDSNYSFTLTSTYAATNSLSHTYSDTGSDYVKMMNGSTNLTGTVTNANVSAGTTYVYFPVVLNANVTSGIKVGYYRVDSQGNPLNADGTVPSGNTNADKAKNATKVQDGTNWPFIVENDGTANASVKTYTAASPNANLELYGGSGSFTVSSDFATLVHTLSMSGTNVYYDQGGSYLTTNSAVPNIGNNALKGTTVWFPVYKTDTHTIQVKENFYLVDENGKAVNGYAPLLSTDRTNPAVTVNANTPAQGYDGGDAFEASTSLHVLYELYEATPGATVTPNFETTLNSMTTSGATTKLVKSGETPIASKNNVAADQVDDYVVYYAVKLKDPGHTSIKYGYYRVDSKGNPLNSGGGRTTGTDSNKVKNAAKIVTPSTETTLNITVATSLTDTVTTYEAWTSKTINGTKWTLYPNGTTGPKLQVTSNYAFGKNVLDLTGAGVYYQLGDTYTAADKSEITNADLSNYTVWFPVYKDTAFSITINQNFYLVDENGAPVNNYASMVDSDISTGSIRVTADVSKGKVDGLSAEAAFALSGLDPNVYELVAETGTAYAQVDTNYESTKTTMNVYGEGTKLVNGETPSTTQSNVTPGNVEKYVIKYAVRERPTKTTKINYVHYLVSATTGKPVNMMNEELKSGYTLVGSKNKYQNIIIKATNTADNPVPTSLLSSAAFTNDLSAAEQKMYTRYNDNRANGYDIVSVYTTGHTVTLTGDGILLIGKDGSKQTATNGEITIGIDDLANYTVYFPLTINTKDKTIKYAFYLLGENDTIPGNIPGAQIGNVGSWTQTTLSTEADKEWPISADKAAEELGIDLNVYELVIQNGNAQSATAYTSWSTGNADECNSFALQTSFTQLVRDGAKVTDDLDVTDDEFNNTTVYFALRRKPDLNATVKYAYYLVSNSGANKGKPINSEGTVLTTPANAYWFLNGANGSATAIAAKDFDVIVPPQAGSVTSGALIGADKYSITDYSHYYTGNKAQFTVTTDYANSLHTVNVSNVTNDADKLGTIWYSVSDGTTHTFNRATVAALEALSAEDLENIVIWFPMYRSGGHNITVNENFYLVDSEGKPVNGFDPLLKDHIGSSWTVTGDEDFPFDGSDTFNNKSGLDKDLFELYEKTPGATVKAEYDTKLNDINTDGTTTKVVKNGNAVDGQDIPADEVEDNVIFYAVKLKKLAVEDTVVLDFGLKTNIDVLNNDKTDLKNGTVSALAGTYEDSYAEPTVGQNKGFTATIKETYGDVSIANNKVVYDPFTMTWDSLDIFTYAAAIKNTAAGDLYYYGKVNVIPATIIYYEDNFLNDSDAVYFDYATYKPGYQLDDKGNIKVDENGYPLTNHTMIDSKWVTVTKKGVVATAPTAGVQVDDRPGDAAQIYGYDKVYTGMGDFSMGSASKVNVSQGNFSVAKFDFSGTGFDVLSMISGETGVIMATVYEQDKYDPTNVNKGVIQSAFVDTYAGYDYVNGAWVANPNAANAMYQVPVIKINDLPYGKYTAVLTFDYFAFSDHNKDHAGYDLYLDAVRIYDPANDGVVNGVVNETIQGAYVADGEGWPEYFELRNLILASKDLDGKTSVNGVVFLDRASNSTGLAIKDYHNYGPNNELYLAPGQSIAFNLNVTTDFDQIHLALKSVGGTAKYKVYNLGANGEISNELPTKSVSSSTDLYYDIEALNGGVVVVSNTGTSSTDAILSLTNVKVTYKSAHTDGIEKGYFNDLKVQDVVDSLGSNTDGDSSVVTSTDPTLTGASLSLNDEVFVNYYFSADDSILNKSGKKITNAGLLLWKRNPGTTKITYADADMIVKGALIVDGKYVIQSPGIAAKELGDTLYARVYVETEDGYAYSKVVTYSPQTYAYNKLKTCNGNCAAKTEKLHRTLVALLNYGTEAQEYFKYNDDIWISKPNEKLTEAQKGLVAGYDENTMVSTQATVTEATINGYTKDTVGIVPTVSFDGAFGLNFKLTLNKAPSGNVSFYYWTAEQYASVGANLTKASGKLTLINAVNGTEYVANVTGIAAKDVMDPIYFAVVYSDGTTNYASAVCAYSISHYCASLIKAEDPITDLAKATAVYGFYAKAYFG